MKRFCCLVLSIFGATASCASSEPTQGVVVNAFADDFTVLKVWYRSELFVEAVPKGQESDAHRVTTGSEHAYAVIARGYDAEAGAPTGPLTVIRTRTPLTVGRGDTIRIVLSESTTSSACFGSPKLTQADFDFIATRIFPGDTVANFDPVKCGSLPPGDGGGDGSDADAAESSASDGVSGG